VSKPSHPESHSTAPRRPLQRGPAAPAAGHAASRASGGTWSAAALGLGLSLVAGVAVAQTPAPPTVSEAAARAAAEPGAVVSDSGLVYRSLQEGSGSRPLATDTVRVHYRGTLPDGREFDSSHSRGQPATFPLNRVIPCWTEGLQRMKVGGKARLTCPPAIAYGDRGAGNVIPPGATLHFEVELLGVVAR
jgi:FKBP-type peptidyl-prolyl cis-trans isomerase FkpA